MKKKTSPTFIIAIVLISAFPLHAGVCPGTSCDGPAELPRSFIDTTFPDVSGYITKTVCQSGCDYSNFQTALNDIANFGGTSQGAILRLAAGQTFIDNYTLPAYTMAPGKWVIIRTDTSDSNLPAEGIRIQPSYSNILAKIQTTNNAPAIQTASNANHYWFMGVEFGPSSTNTASDTIVLLTKQETSATQVPKHITIDRCYIHGSATGDYKRGVNPGGSDIAIVNSYISDFHVRGQEAQAISTWNGPGPIKIVNNYLEGAGENIMFGGATATIPNLVVSDIEIRFNHFYKPMSWFRFHPSYKGIRWTVKNLFELKNAQRVLIHGNVLENNWADAQTGIAVLFTPRSQNGAMPWATVNDITVRHNLIQNSAGGLAMAGSDSNGQSLPTHRIAIHDNVFANLNHSAFGNGDGSWLKLTNGSNAVGHDWEIKHNTAFQSDNLITLGDTLTNPMTGVILSNNIAAHNAYGITGTGTSPGMSTISTYFSSPVIEWNVMAAPSRGIPVYPPNNFVVPTWAAVGMVAYPSTTPDYHLAPSSPYKGKSSEATLRLAAGLSTDLGADIDSLIRETCYALTGNPAGSCTSLPSPLPPPSGLPPQQPTPPPSTVAPLPKTIVRPNPWRSTLHSSSPITFDNLSGASLIKIFTMSGHFVREIPVSGGSAAWDLTNASGKRVASGIYLFEVSDSHGQGNRGKLAIIK